MLVLLDPPGYRVHTSRIGNQMDEKERKIIFNPFDFV